MNPVAYVSFFASSDKLHTPPIQAEALFTVGPLTVHNSTLLGWIIAALVLGGLIWTARQISVRPNKNKLINLIEAMCEYVVGLMSEVMQSRDKAIKYAPLILTLFFVLLANNWLELLPGINHSFLATTAEGSVPLFRGFSADVNNTLSAAIMTMVLVQIYSIKELGGIGLFKRFFSDKPYNPVNIFIGLIEIISELAKVVSLSLRLFGNIFAGGVLLVVIFAITSWFAPVASIPFVLMVAFDGFIQAFVFAMLATVYITIATIDHSSHDGKEEPSPTRDQAFDGSKLVTSSD